MNVEATNNKYISINVSCLYAVFRSSKYKMNRLSDLVAGRKLLVGMTEVEQTLRGQTISDICRVNRKFYVNLK